MAEQQKEIIQKKQLSLAMLCGILGCFCYGGRRLADDVWRQRTYRQSDLAYAGNGTDRSMEKRTGNGFGISGHYFLWNCIILSGKIHKREKRSEDIPLSECIWTDTVALSASVLYYDLICLCMDEWEWLSGHGTSRMRSIVYTLVMDHLCK